LTGSGKLNQPLRLASAQLTVLLLAALTALLLAPGKASAAAHTTGPGNTRPLTINAATTAISPASYAYDSPTRLSPTHTSATQAQAHAGTGAAGRQLPLVGQDRPTSRACVAAEDAASQVPGRLARVVDARAAGSPTLGAPGSGRVFVAAADDLNGISTSEGIAQRLTLLDEAGKLRTGPFEVSTFDTPAEGPASPVFRTNPGFL